MDPPRKKKKIIRIDNLFKSCSDVESRPTTNSNLLSSQETASAQAVVEAHWFKEFSWLDYDERKDSVTCYICKRHKTKLQSERNKEDAFFKTGFRNWKKALCIFKDHQNSKCHTAALAYETTVPCCGNVREMSNQAVKDYMEQNRRCLLKIIECLQFLGRQGLALRGDDNDENSNFIQLLKLRSKDFPELSKWMLKKTDKYLSHDIQNEIIMLMAHQIIRGICEKIQKSFYAIICDEYTDISNKEQLTLCLRWVDDCFRVREDFIGFYEVKNIKSDTIVCAIYVATNTNITR